MRCEWGRRLLRLCRAGGSNKAARIQPRSRHPCLPTSELDKRITSGWSAFDEALTAAHVPHEGYVYSGANHGFHNDTTPRYDEAAAKLAWHRTLDWFNKYLKSPSRA